MYASPNYSSGFNTHHYGVDGEFNLMNYVGAYSDCASLCFDGDLFIAWINAVSLSCRQVRCDVNRFLAGLWSVRKDGVEYVSVVRNDGAVSVFVVLGDV